MVPSAIQLCSQHVNLLKCPDGSAEALQSNWVKLVAALVTLQKLSAPVQLADPQLDDVGKEEEISSKLRQKSWGVCSAENVCVLPLPWHSPLALHVCECVCAAWLPEKGVSACLPLKGREGSVHGYSSLLSVLFLFRTHSLSGSLRIRPLSLSLLYLCLSF